MVLYFLHVWRYCNRSFVGSRACHWSWWRRGTTSSHSPSWKGSSTHNVATVSISLLEIIFWMLFAWEGLWTNHLHQKHFIGLQHYSSSLWSLSSHLKHDPKGNGLRRWSASSVIGRRHGTGWNGRGMAGFGPIPWHTTSAQVRDSLLWAPLRWGGERMGTVHGHRLLPDPLPVLRWYSQSPV